MTTNVVDIASKVLASDSRWSFPLNNAIGQVHAVIYVDDADFDKIEVGAEYSLIFAGNSQLIQDWKTWFRDPGKLVKARPPVVDDFALCMIEMATQEVKFEHGQRIVGTDHRFAGTGAYGAYKCWHSNSGFPPFLRTLALSFQTAAQTRLG